MTDKEQLLTTRQTAAMLQYKENTLCQWRTNPDRPKDLPFVKQGRSVRYRLSDIQAFINSNLQHPFRQRGASITGYRCCNTVYIALLHNGNKMRQAAVK